MMNFSIARLFYLPVLVLLLGAVPAQARSIHEKVARFYLREAAQQALVLEQGGDRCEPIEPAGKDCILYVAGDFASQEIRIKAARACIGNRGVACAKYVAGDYASFDAREKSAKSCSRVSEVECVKFVAGEYASFSTRTEAAEACKHSNLSCVQSVVGQYPTYRDKVQAARACAGELE